MRHYRSRTPLLAAIATGVLIFATGVPAQQSGQQGQTTQSQQTRQSQPPSQYGQTTRQGQSTASQRETQRMQSAQAGELSRKDRKFVETALSSSQAEIELGRLAEQRGASADVREFGQMMQQHHRMTRDKLAALHGEPAAATAGLDRKHQSTVDQLGGVQDREEFDARYSKAMVEMHRNDIKLFEEVANSNEYSDEVRELARTTLRDLRNHQQLAQQMERKASQIAQAGDEQD